MISEPTHLIVEQFRQGMLSRGLPVEEVILYGSRARGEETEDSDYDMLIILAERRPGDWNLVSDAAWQLEFDHSLTIDFVLATRAELESGPMQSSFLAMAVRAEGVSI